MKKIRNKKRFAAIVLAVLLSLSLLAGLFAGLRHSFSGQKVMVVKAEELSYGGFGLFADTMLEGIVTSDASQRVYLTDGMKVNDVMVKEGQTVKKGDVLMSYDTKETDRKLQREEINRAQIELNIQIASKNIETLKGLSPAAEQPEIPEEPEVPEEPETPETPEPAEPPVTPPAVWTCPSCGTENDEDGSYCKNCGKPKEEQPYVNPYPDAPVHTELNDTVQAYNDNPQEEAIGSFENPYRFLCADGVVILPSFIRSMQEKAAAAGAPLYFVLEVREGNTTDGAVRKAWMQDAGCLSDVADDWTGSLQAVSNTGGSGFRAVRTSDRQTVLVGTGNGNDANAGDSDTASPEAISLIAPDAKYTGPELAAARNEEAQRLKGLQLDLQEQDLKLSLAQEAAKNGTETAKTDGIVKKVGDPKNPPKDGSPFLEIGASGGLTVIGGLGEQKLGSVKPGDMIQIMSWQSGTVVEGTIREISPYPDTSGRFSSSDANDSIYPFTADLTGNTEGLSDGEWVQITMLSDPEAPSDGFSLMKAFILEDEKGSYVYKRGKEGRLKKTYIEISKVNGDTCTVVSGITSEDWLAFPYGKNVRDGAKTREGTMEELYKS